MYGAVTLYGAPFQNASTRTQFGNSVRDLVPPLSIPTTPNWQRHQALTPIRFRLIPFRSPLLRESLLLSFPRATEMFQFARFPLPALCVQTGVTHHDVCWVSPFGHPRVKAWSAAHRGFSQPPTSFIGSRRQGIHRWLFVAWNFDEDARVRYATLNDQASFVKRTTRGLGPSRSESPNCLYEGADTGTPSKRNRGQTMRRPAAREGRNPTISERTNE